MEISRRSDRKITGSGLAVCLISSILSGTGVTFTSTAKEEAVPFRLFVAPCTAPIRLGRVSLIMTPLTATGRTCIGEYQLKVLPYFFKNEKGTLILEASNDMIKQLISGHPVSFVGKATSKDGKVKHIAGKATPSIKDHGSVLVSINTDFGPIIFNSDYHFE